MLFTNELLFYFSLKMVKGLSFSFFLLLLLLLPFRRASILLPVFWPSSIFLFHNDHTQTDFIACSPSYLIPQYEKKKEENLIHYVDLWVKWIYLIGCSYWWIWFCIECVSLIGWFNSTQSMLYNYHEGIFLSLF